LFTKLEHAIRALLAFLFGLRGCRLCRAEEIRLAWRKELQQRLGHDPHEDEASRAGPAEGVKVWVLCALFLALEASALTLDGSCVKVGRGQASGQCASVSAEE